MGNSWSGSRRRTNYLHHPPPPPHLPSPYYYSTESHPPPPPPPPPPPQGYLYTTAAPYAPHSNSYVTPPPVPPPPPPQTHCFYYSNGYSNCAHHTNSMVNRLHYHAYYANQVNGWPAIRPQVGQAVQVQPPAFVDHQTAKKVRNDVNVHKDTVRLEIDERNPDHHLVSFVFDAIYDGWITIFYFAKEEEKCRLVPVFPEAFEPIRIPFQKGVAQKFFQPSGTGIDLGFFELDDLSKPSAEDVYPLVICAETCSTILSADESFSNSLLDVTPHKQITQAVIEKRNGGNLFQVKVVRQILWIDGARYELRDLYGIGSSAAAGFHDNDTGKDCVICMTEPKDTAVLPCRHMCMCSECAKALRLQSNKCPICRQPIEELIEIKINNGNQ